MNAPPGKKNISLMFDCHIHLRQKEDKRKELASRLNSVGMEGGIIISHGPKSFNKKSGFLRTNERLKRLLFWTQDNPDFFPFYWIDPLEKDALDQVDEAVKQGVLGFKMLASNYYVRDPKPFKVIKKIAKKGKPILFHSGILWDTYDSARFNRPGEFEALINVENIRFALAHISWPWYDECIAVFGKFLASNNTVEMFIETTPGTPVIYRKEALTRLMTVGYPVERNIFFGSDCGAENYNCDWTREWIHRDREIMSGLGVSEENIRYYQGENLKRFVGVSEEKVLLRRLKPGE
ncbi:MAG: hypothetical protein V1913_06375 [Fibrobacterota bacterium]